MIRPIIPEHMGNGKRVQIEDGSYKVNSVQKSTFPGKRYRVLLNIDDRDGLTPYLTNEEINVDCTEIQITDMEIADVE